LKHLDLDWADIVESLPAWEGLPIRDRRNVLEIFSRHPLNGVIPRGMAGESSRALLESGLWVSAANRSGFKLADGARRMVSAWRALLRVPVFDQEPTPELLARYLQEHFALYECEALIPGTTYYTVTEVLASFVASIDTVQGFLAARDPRQWEESRLPPRATPILSDPEVALALRLLIERLVAAGEPVPLAELSRRLPGRSLPELGPALHAGLRQALLLGGMRGSDLSPMVGLWPPLLHRLTQPPPEPPGPVRPHETCEGTGLDDMLIVLARCQAQPPRLRQSDLLVFAKTQQEMEEALPPLPKWAEAALDTDRSDRLSRTSLELERLGMTEIAKGPTLMASATGERWLRLGEEERLRWLCPPRPRRPSGKKRLPFDRESFLWSVFGSKLAEAEVEAMISAFSSIPEGEFVGLGAFFDFQARSNNPWVGTGLEPLLSTGWRVRAPPTTEERESAWIERLSAFIVLRLFPLQGITLGISPEGRICLAVTDLGRYLLGQRDSFELPQRAPAQIVVQPNFEIVFLAPAPSTEASLARFAERRGRGLGSLFQITRKSVLAAAATGLDARQILSALEDAAAQPIPGNVRREIEGWFGRVRTVIMRPAELVICPDAETATRVVAAGGRNTLILAGTTIVELIEPRERAALVRKLREEGVMVAGSQENPAKPRTPQASRGKRRRW
jgi:hypothetical protein